MAGFAEPDATPRPPDGRDAEIEHLRRERDDLRARLDRAHNETEKLREHLRRLTASSKSFATSMNASATGRRQARRRLLAQYHIGRALEQARDLLEAGPIIFEILGKNLGWQVGVLWTLDEDANVLRCGGVWRGETPETPPDRGFEETCRRASFAYGAGPPGHAWSRGEAILVEDLLNDGAHLRPEPRREALEKEGLRGALAFPLRDGGRLAGVFEVLSHKTSEPDEDLCRTMSIVGVQIGQFVERRRAEEALREREELYRLIAENSTDMISKHTSEGVYTYASPACRSLLGYEPQELVGRSAYDFFHPEDLETIQKTHSTILRQPDTRTVTYRIRRKDSSYIWFETTSRTIRDPETDEEKEILAVSRNIMERKRAEEERERFLAREWIGRAQAEERRRISRELHDRVAHAIAIVHQNLELHEALKERDPAMAAAKMKSARETAKEALALTRGLSVELRDREVQRGLEAAIKDLLRDIVPSPMVRCEFPIEGDETLIPLDVRNQLFLILREAVRNAVAHSGCDRLTIELDISPQMVVGTVEDNGRGFDAEEERPGSGLRSMEERAALLGGTLGVSSEPGAGTKVKVTVPLEDT